MGKNKPPRLLEQEFRIKKLLAQRGLTMSSLARELQEPAGSVANNIYGYRRDPALQARIAAFLELPVVELFIASDSADGGDGCPGAENAETPSPPAGGLVGLMARLGRALKAAII